MAAAAMTILCSFTPKDTVRLMTYNVGAFSKYTKNSIPEVAEIINGIHPDVVGLNEVDCRNPRHLYDQTGALAEELGGWQHYYAAAFYILIGSYGNGVVLPPEHHIIKTFRVSLDRAGGYEKRSVAVVETDDFVYGACHLDHKTDEAQQSQIKQLTDWFTANYGNCKKPVFFGGDMNATPNSKGMEALSENWELLSGTGLSFPSEKPDRCIDFIFRLKSSAPVKVTGCGVVSEGLVTTASDHLPVWVEVTY